MRTLALLLVAGCTVQPDEPPHPERDLRLSLVLKTPQRTHPWWPILVEAWVENTSSQPVPIVRATSWDDRTEPTIQWQRTWPDGRTAPLVSAEAGSCGMYDSNWVHRIVEVPPGGRERITAGGLAGRLLADPERPDTFELRLEYGFHATPSRPMGQAEVPLEEDGRFGALAGVAPFRLVSNAVTLEVVPPSLRSQELERELSVEVELVDDGRFLAWEEPRGRARLRNDSTRTQRIPHPDGCMGLVRRGGPLATGWSPEHTLELRAGETLEFPLEKAMLGRDWREHAETTLELVYRWDARPAGLNHDAPDVIAAYGPLGDLPPFELRSRPCQTRRLSPLTVELVPLAPVPAKRRYPLSQLFALLLRNTGDRELELASPENPLHVQIHLPDSQSHYVDVAHTLVLPPHAEHDLTADPELGNAWIHDRSTGIEPTRIGRASVSRAGWYRPVESREVEFEFE